MAEQDAGRPDPLAAPDAAYDLGGLPGGDIVFADTTAPSSTPPPPGVLIPTRSPAAEPVPPQNPLPWNRTPAPQPPAPRTPLRQAGAIKPWFTLASVIVAVVIAIQTIAALFAYVSTDRPDGSRTATTSDRAPTATHQILLEVDTLGTGYVYAHVPGTRDVDADGRVTMPWRHTVGTEANAGGISIVATAAGNSDSITCRITVDGVTVAEETSTYSVLCQHDLAYG